MKEYLWVTGYSLLDLLKYYLFLRLVLGIRMKKKNVLIPIWLVSSIVIGIIYYRVCGLDKKFFIIPNICSLFLIAFVHKKDRLKSILYIVLAWIVMDILSESVRLVMFLSTRDSAFLDTRFGDSLVHKCIVLALPIMYDAIVNGIIKKKIDYSFFPYQWGIIVASFGGLALILPSLEKVLNAERIDRQERIEMSLTMIALFFLFVVIMIWQSYVMKKNIVLREEENKYIYMLDAQKKHFEELQRRNADVRAFRHDMCTHIAIIEKYLDLNEYDKLSEYLKSIKDTTGLNETKSYTGNLAVDAVINDQIRDIAGKNIKFSFDGFFSIGEEISDFDLCSIFYNLIQNAIEGCEKVASDSKNISIKTKNIGEKLGIVIENDTVLETLPADCIIPTTKEDKKNHGYGMKSIKNAVEKYNGIYNNSIKDGKFIVNIVI